MRGCCRCARLHCLDDFVHRFKALRQSPRYLLVVYIISFIDSFSFYAFSYALIMHLGMEVGLPDAYAGLFYGVFGVCISVSALGLGFAADWMGVRNSICVASAVGFVGRLGMAYAVLGRSAWLSTLLLCAVIGPCIALMAPPIPTAIKRFTVSDTKDLGYTVNYGIMNVAAFLATEAVDAIRLSTTDTVLLLPPYAMLIAFTGVLQIPIFFAAVFGLRDEYMDEDTKEMRPFIAENTNHSLRQRVAMVVKRANFWKALVMIMCLMGVRSSFRYFDALYLPYVVRAFEDAATFPYLSLLALNPVIVTATTLTGAITIVTGRMTQVNALLLGTFIGGIAPFWMAVGPYLSAIILYVLFTTLGEIIWSPVAYSYVMALTTNGEEGAYFALAGLPTFLAKVLTGGLTGGLMSNFCAARMVNGTLAPPPPPQLGGTPGQCNALAIWGIIGLTTIISFFSLLLLKRYLSRVEAPAPTSETDPIELDNVTDSIDKEAGDETDDFELTTR